jgi:hypothetical protein
MPNIETDLNGFADGLQCIKLEKYEVGKTKDAVASNTRGNAKRQDVL